MHSDVEAEIDSKAENEAVVAVAAALKVVA